MLGKQQLDSLSTPHFMCSVKLWSGGYAAKPIPTRAGIGGLLSKIVKPPLKAWFLLHFLHYLRLYCGGLLG